MRLPLIPLLCLFFLVAACEKEVNGRRTVHANYGHRSGCEWRTFVTPIGHSYQRFGCYHTVTRVWTAYSPVGKGIVYYQEFVRFGPHVVHYEREMIYDNVRRNTIYGTQVDYDGHLFDPPSRPVVIELNDIVIIESRSPRQRRIHRRGGRREVIIIDQTEPDPPAIPRRVPSRTYEGKRPTSSIQFEIPFDGVGGKLRRWVAQKTKWTFSGDIFKAQRVSLKQVKKLGQKVVIRIDLQSEDVSQVEQFERELLSKIPDGAIDFVKTWAHDFHFTSSQGCQLNHRGEFQSGLCVKNIHILLPSDFDEKALTLTVGDDSIIPVKKA